MTTAAVSTASYPATPEIDYPEHDLNRLSTLLRPILVIPIAIVLAFVTGPSLHFGDAEWGRRGVAIEGGGFLVVATALMLIIRQKYPRWWFDWNVQLVNFGTRVIAYLALLRDEYPSTDEEQAVHIEIAYPDAAALNPWLPLCKWLLAIPHYVALGVLAAVASVCVVMAWVAILVTGRYPRPLFDFVVGVFRWWLRVAAYAFLLVTDRYPPFRLSA